MKDRSSEEYKKAHKKIMNKMCKIETIKRYEEKCKLIEKLEDENKMKEICITK
jgi:hypothetical protein